MLFSINLTLEQEAELVKEAASKGFPFEDYVLQKLINLNSASKTTQGESAVSINMLADDPLERFETLLKIINDPNAPAISPEYLTREAMYEGRGEKCTDPNCISCNGSK